MTLDRTTPPSYQPIRQIVLPSINKTTLTNGVPLYIVSTGLQPANKLEIVFEAGSMYDTQKLSSLFTSKLLMGGTSSRSAGQLSEAFDQFGGFTEISQNSERLTLTIYGLAQHFAYFLNLIQEIITESEMPEEELSLQKNIVLQTHQVNLEKTAYVANQEFRKYLFGENHQWGYSMKEPDIMAIERSLLVQFYEKNIKNRPFVVFAAGQVSDKLITEIDQTLGQIFIQHNKQTQLFSTPTYQPNQVLVEKQDSLQSSIRLGRMMVTKTHTDFHKILVTNTLFGGYFGSRLMKNIREEKGFTYGISSSLVSTKGAGYLAIGTDVKKEFTAQTLTEIEKEIAILQNERVSENELETVKNYLIGSFASSLNTPFEIVDKHKTLIFEELPETFYTNYIDAINTVTSSDIQKMAQTYYSINEMVEVVVGEK